MDTCGPACSDEPIAFNSYLRGAFIFIMPLDVGDTLVWPILLLATLVAEPVTDLTFLPYLAANIYCCLSKLVLV